MRAPLVLVLVLASSLVAGAAPRTRLKKPLHGMQMKTAPYTVAAGADREWCEYRRLPLKKPLDVGGFEVRMPPGAHHFVVWGYGGNQQDDSQFPQGPVESIACAGLAPDDLFPSVIIPLQSPNSRFKFPKGVALQLEPGQQIWLNPHLKNFDAAAMTPDIRFNFYAAKKGTVQHRVQGLIVGNMGAINVPPGGDQTITAEWTAPVAVNLVFLAGHQHQLGTYSNIELVGEDGVTTTKIYENTEWEHPVNYWPPSAIHLDTGRKLRITCTWHNPGNQPVRFGPKTTDEMCLILGFFYRDAGDTTPVQGGGCLPAKSGLLCPLAPAIAVQ